MDVASALRPALEAAAATLGRVRVASERTEEPVAALDGLRDKGMFVAVPLMAGGEHQATFALQVTLPATHTKRGSLDLLRHVAMEVTVEIGRTRMTVQELLSLHPGEVVELDRAASAPADLLVNGTLIARGEVVVVDEDFGLRISEIVTDAAEAL
jgi:flagellar motor switch protein FliN/FliY